MAFVTSRVIQGDWKRKRFPGNENFAANCKQLASAFRGARFRKRKAPVEALFAAVEERSVLLEMLDTRHALVPFLIRVAMFEDRWVRPPDEWEPKSFDPKMQVAELMAHLFERYRAPRFFEHTWWPKRRRERDWLAFGWYVHVGAGGSIRSAPHLPTKLTKAAGRHMMVAPKKYLPLQALRWGQVRAAGAEPHLADAVLSTRAATDFANDRMWLLFFSKLAEAPELPSYQVGPLVDFIAHGDNQPAFTIRGRTVASLLRAMDRWHAELRANQYRSNLGIRFTGWKPLVGVEPMTLERDDGVWTIRELTSADALFEEGRKMRHCVATYAHACYASTQSIWVVDGPNRTHATIRIEVARKTVVEARGFANHPIDKATARFVKRWADENDLAVGALTIA